MKIALNVEYVGARRGGAEKYAGVLARWLAAAGQEVHLFAREVDDGELPASIKVHPVRPWSLPGFGGFHSYQFARASEQALREHPLDLIIGFVKVWHQHVCLAVGGAHPATLDYNSRRFRSPSARFLWWLGKVFALKQWVYRYIAHKQFHTTHQPHIIAPSRMVAEHFQRYHGVASERISVVYNANEDRVPSADSAAARAAFRLAHGLCADDVAVLFVARNYALKGLEPLLESFARATQKRPNARLMVCGGGGRQDRNFRRRAVRLGIDDRGRFFGFVADIRACFSGCDVFAFPTFYDPCSLVVPEALAAGLPVLTTRQNGASELLTDSVDGFIVDSPWDLDAMSDRLGRLIDDGALREAMSIRARAAARTLTMAASRRQLLDAFLRAATDPAASPPSRRAA